MSPICLNSGVSVEGSIAAGVSGMLPSPIRYRRQICDGLRLGDMRTFLFSLCFEAFHAESSGTMVQIEFLGQNTNRLNRIIRIFKTAL